MLRDFVKIFLSSPQTSPVVSMATKQLRSVALDVSLMKIKKRSGPKILSLYIFNSRDKT